MCILRFVNSFQMKMTRKDCRVVVPIVEYLIREKTTSMANGFIMCVRSYHTLTHTPLGVLNIDSFRLACRQLFNQNHLNCAFNTTLILVNCLSSVETMHTNKMAECRTDPGPFQWFSSCYFKENSNFYQYRMVDNQFGTSWVAEFDLNQVKSIAKRCNCR